MNSIGELAPRDANPDGEARAEIARLEDRIEELAAAIENCRKIMLASRIAMTAGGLLIGALVFGLIRFDALAMIAGVTAVIGGIVLLGSNNSTSQQATAALQAAEARRAELIGSIDLRLVGEERGAD